MEPDHKTPLAAPPRKPPNAALVGVAAIIILIAFLVGRAFGPAHGGDIKPGGDPTLRQVEGACVTQRTFEIDGRIYLCVGQAPQDLCTRRLVVDECFEFLGQSNRVIFDALGQAAAVR